MAITASSLAADINTSALSQNGWYSDDTRADGSGSQVAGTNLKSTTLTAAPESGSGNPAHDADILNQILFGQAPPTVPVSTWTGAVNLRINSVGGGSGKSTISHRKDDGIGHAPGSALNNPAFTASYNWIGTGNLPFSAGLKIGIKTSEFGLAPGSSRTGEGAWDKLIIYEPGNQQPDASRTSDGTWYSESITASTGRWWVVDRIPGGGNSICCPQKLSNMSTSLASVGSRTVAAVWAVITAPGSIITSIQFGVGSGNAGANVYVNQLQTSFYRPGDRTTFGPPPPTLTLASTGTCYTTGSTVTVHVNMSNAGQNILGGQFFLGYNTSKLTFVSVTTGNAPFTMEVYRCTPNSPMAGPCIPLPGQIDYGVGVPFGNTTGTAADTTMAVITFTAAAEVCNTSGLVYFRPHFPSSYLTNANTDPITTVLSDLSAITVDSTNPSITCPSNVVVGCGLSTDPPATGTASATDCGPVTITYNDDRSGLTGCNATGTIIRTWKATDCAGNMATCQQMITLQDMTAPTMTACPSTVNVNADAGACCAVVTYTSPTATDSCYMEGFEDPQFESGAPIITPSVNWNDYNSQLTRVASGTDGIPSKSGGFHGYANSTVLPAPPDDFSGIFSRLRGYSSVFGTGFKSSVDVYINLADPKVATNTYGFDISTAANNQSGSHRRDFIFHAAADNSDAVNTVFIGADNNTNFAVRQDLDTLGNNYEITASGWYTFEWNFRNNSGVLAVDLVLRDSLGTQLFIETRQDNSDLIATIVGGNRYMWFTFISADNLAIDNTTLIRNVPVVCGLPSGTCFNSGANIVTCTATDACGNASQCQFNVNVSGFNEMVVSVELAGGGWPTDLYRCVTFQLFNCPTATTVSQQLHFVNGIATNQLVLVPCDDYECITARDKLHTLRRTADAIHFGISGTQYFANFTGTDALLGGNLNDDMFIDILDFGGFAGKYLFNYGTGDTTCSTPSIHADISGDGLVFNEDFSFIQINFLVFSEANCCMLLNQVANADPNEPESRSGKPVTSISVKELNRRGLSDLARGDLNHDGMLDTQDIAAFLGGARP